MLKNYLFLTLLCFTFLVPLQAGSNETPQADSGVITISRWDFSEESLLLHGQWEFYWDTLIYPAAFDTLDLQTIRTFMKVPSAWSSKKAGSYPIKGYATYRLVIKTHGMEGNYSIRLYDLFSASKVWFDGRLIYETGTTGYNESSTVPGYRYADIPVFLSRDKQEYILIAHLSNFDHTRSGITKPVRFGRYDDLVDSSRKWLITILLIVGVIIFISINHLLNYFLYKNEITHLLFGLLCLVMIIRNISTGQRMLVYLFPDFNWELLFKFDNFSGFGTIPLFAIFLAVLYPKEFPKLLLYVLVGIGALITLFVFVTPQMVYGRIRIFFELYVLLGGLTLTFFVLLRAALHKREGALLTLIGFFLLYATAINDVLISMGVIGGVEVASYGLLIYMLVQSFVLSRGSALAVAENQRLGLALKEEKQLLENRVTERTQELEQMNLEIIEQQDTLKNQSWVNESLARINNVLNSHNKNSINQLTNLLISEILEILEAQVGVVYLINEDKTNPKLELIGAKNASTELLNAEPISPGEGLLGACYLDKESKIFNNVTDTYVKLDSGLGKTSLKHLILIPLFTSDESLGVIEIASYNEFSERKQELLVKISESISSTIKFLRLNEKNSLLVIEYQEKQSMLNRNEEEMQLYMEELNALKEEVERMRKDNVLDDN
ncbi:MAG: GAF domain-containing protein [Bacteroidales bacterium]|nr:GAF domain-containing protein [Bacteroidales bacterium]